MRLTSVLTCALLAATALAGGQASANTCQAEGITCPTSMPIDGYCECKAHGVTKDGTVVRASQPRPSRHVPGPDCHATPQAPGCPHS